MGIVFRRQWLKAMGLFLVGLVYLFEPVLAGKIYTWTDEKGIVRIDGRPPADGSVVKNIIHYQDPPAEAPTQDHAMQEHLSVEDQQTADLKKKLKRLKEREVQIIAIVEENKETIMLAEKDAAKYRRRSGAYARRNEKIYDRQLIVLKNNLRTYQSDLRYVKEDIDETEQTIKDLKGNIESGNRRP